MHKAILLLSSVFFCFSTLARRLFPDRFRVGLLGAAFASLRSPFPAVILPPLSPSSFLWGHPVAEMQTLRFRRHDLFSSKIHDNAFYFPSHPKAGEFRGVLGTAPCSLCPLQLCGGGGFGWVFGGLFLLKVLGHPPS